MYGKLVLSVVLVVSGGTAVMAGEQEEEKSVPCHVNPLFHCAQSLLDGTVLGHFGYTYTCADGSEPEQELYVDIGEDNLFSPGAEDRGQSKIFWSGEHVDVFEVEFSAEEIRENSSLGWTVQGRSARVDFMRSGDAFLDCAELPR